MCPAYHDGVVVGSGNDARGVNAGSVERGSAEAAGDDASIASCAMVLSVLLSNADEINVRDDPTNGPAIDLTVVLPLRIARTSTRSKLPFLLLQLAAARTVHDSILATSKPP